MLDNLTRRLGGIFSGLRRKGRLTESDVKDMLREVRVALLEADVNLKVAKEFVEKVREKAVGEDLYGTLSAEQTLIKIVRDQLVELLGTEDRGVHWSPSPPTVVLMCGLQGSGKTTTCAKLALWFKKAGKKPVLAACDVQRPAAIKQLQVLGEQVDAPVYAEEGGDPVQIAKKAKEYCKDHFCDVLIVDTAGRLTIDDELMDQLAAIGKAVGPSETLLVLDSTTGQEAVNVAGAFHERNALTGVIFTKLDGDTRGGAVLSVREATGVPVRFVGEGEQVEALTEFRADRMAERIIGMGDVMGIIEKAEEAVDLEAAAGLQAKMKTGRLDFNDMLDQFRAIRKMGPLKNVMKMIPGLTAQVSEEELDSLDEGRMDQVEAIVLSMTPGERENPDILNGSRRRRIAVGSGTSPQEVNQLVDKLYLMRKQMKQMSKLEKRLGKRRRR
ncbi:MAG TPA: signal recognition particle protein [Fimbriimonadaceae bacterium]|nr:signal recognition particle protein [Fimbriimonadaceae bacterium]